MAQPASCVLVDSLAAWGRADFLACFVRECEALSPDCLPLQRALAYSSVVAEAPFRLIPHAVHETAQGFIVTAGVMFEGVIAGCSCADDPTPVPTQTEYCELALHVDRCTGQLRAELLPDA